MDGDYNGDYIQERKNIVGGEATFWGDVGVRGGDGG